jgi:hypothetical protein
VTSVASRIDDVRAARAPSNVYASNISRSGVPIRGSWKKWSMTNRVSNPAPSAVVAMSATRSKRLFWSVSG